MYQLLKDEESTYISRKEVGIIQTNFFNSKLMYKQFY